MRVLCDMMVSPFLFQSPEWTSVNVWDAPRSPYYGSFLCAVLKGLLTEEEASFCHLGPPTTASREEWFCCLSPCPEYKRHLSINVYVVTMMQMLRSKFAGSNAQHTAHAAAVKSVLDSFKGVFVRQELTEMGRSHYYEPLLLIPVNRLPQGELKLLRESIPAQQRGNVGNFFVCPAHFGFAQRQAESPDVDLRFFTFHGFKLQLMFPPCGYSMRGHRGGPRTTPETQEVLRHLCSVHRSNKKQKGKKRIDEDKVEECNVMHGISQLREVFTGIQSHMAIRRSSHDVLSVRGRDNTVPFHQIFLNTSRRADPPSRLIRPVFSGKSSQLKKELSRRLKSMVVDFSLVANYFASLRVNFVESTPFRRWEHILDHCLPPRRRFILPGMPADPPERESSSSSSPASPASASSLSSSESDSESESDNEENEKESASEGEKDELPQSKGRRQSTSSHSSGVSLADLEPMIELGSADTTEVLVDEDAQLPTAKGEKPDPDLHDSQEVNVSQLSSSATRHITSTVEDRCVTYFLKRDAVCRC